MKGVIHPEEHAQSRLKPAYDSKPPTLQHWLFAWLGAAAVLLLAKASTLKDPHFWDTVGCYVPQARFLSAIRFPLSALAVPSFVRPPLFTGLIAVVMQLISPSALALHVTTCLFTALTLPAAFFMTRALGGTRSTSFLAALFLAVSPTFFSQSVLVQCDLPAATLVAVAWACLLQRRVGWFVLFASLAVLTKESSYYICIPAAVLLYCRTVQEGQRLDARGKFVQMAALRRVWPVFLPWVVLCGWLCLHWHLTGHIMARDHVVVIGNPRATGAAMLHNFIESGRFSLMIFAVPFVLSVYRGRLPTSGTGRSLDPLGILATALAVVLLPFCFPAGLPRYMMSSLPPLCVLAALGLSRFTSRQRLGTAILLAVIFIGNWHGDSWHENPGFHLERNLDYRELLFLQRDAAQALAAQHPHGVLAAFPMYAVLLAPKEDGYLTSPLPVHLAHVDEPLSELCKNDYLIESDGETIKPLVQKMLTYHAGSLWREFGSPRMAGTKRLTPFWARRDQTIRIYRIQCPAGET